MAVPGLDHAREILAGFDLPNGIVVHSEGVRRVAAEAARLVRKAGIPIDVRLVEVAALLHDIDKLQSRASGEEHGILGARWLSEMGYSELAIPVASHPLRCLLDAERYPIGWPSVLVSLADKHVGQGFMTIDERLDEMIERYPQHRGEIGSARRPAHALEQELAEAIDLTTDEVLERLQAAWQAGATTP
jgi:putative nucleotidyltransferase with HDIG domain